MHGILNPALNSLLSRVRHTNTPGDRGPGFSVLAGAGDDRLSLVDGVPTVLQVLAAVRPNFSIAQAFMAQEFLRENTPATQAAFARALEGVVTAHEPHVEFKRRVPGAIGLIRTGDTVQYANMILVSG